MRESIYVKKLLNKKVVFFIVELETGCYLADGEGDPSRTLVETNAKRFDKNWKALKALNEAMQYRNFKNPAILIID